MGLRRLIFAFVSAPIMAWAVAAHAAIIGTDGNDLLFFNGPDSASENIQTLSTTITNAYSGDTVAVNGTFNVNQETYDGQAGIDTLLATNFPDFFAIRDGGGNQTISNVEVMIFGAGGDIVDLSDASIALGDMLIDTGGGDDVIWANAGDDTLRGFGGDDIIDGGPGNDTIDGNADQDDLSGGIGDDVLNGGAGADLLDGGDGDDTLFYTADAFDATSGRLFNHDTFIGGPGMDELILPGSNDVLFLGEAAALPRHPLSSGPRVSGIETVKAGGGDDSIYFDLASDIGLIDGGDGLDELVLPTGLDLIDLDIAKTGDMLFDIAFGPVGMFSTNFVEQLRFDNGDVFDLASFVPPVAVPEPGSLALLLAGLIGFGAIRRVRPAA